MLKKALILSLFLFICFIIFAVTLDYASQELPSDDEFSDPSEYGGWMDVKTVYVEYDNTSLYFRVEYFQKQPNIRDHLFKGVIELDIDKDAATGCNWDDHECGVDYKVVYAYSATGSSYPNGAWLYRWNPSAYRFEGPSELFIEGLDYGVRVAVPFSMIQNPLTINWFVKSECETHDWINRTFIYSVDRDQTMIVDGNPSDWRTISPVITDPQGDVVPSDFDMIQFYTISDTSTIYHRIDVTGTLILPQEYRRAFYYVYYDIDNNALTGGDFGAEYRLWIGLYSSYYSMLDKWNDTSKSWDFAMDWNEAMEKIPVRFNTVVEFSLPLSSIGITFGKNIRILVGGNFVCIVDDYVPNAGYMTIQFQQRPNGEIPWSLNTILLVFGIIGSISGPGLFGLYVFYERWKTKGLRLTEKGKRALLSGNLVKAAEYYAKASLVSMKRKSKTAEASIIQYAKLARIIICQGTLKGEKSLIERANNIQNALKNNTLLAQSRYTCRISQIDVLLEKARNNDLDFIIRIAVDEELIKESLDKLTNKKNEIELKDMATQLGYTLEATRRLIEKSIEKHKIEGFLTLDKNKYISKHYLAKILYETIEKAISKNNRVYTAIERKGIG